MNCDCDCGLCVSTGNKIGDEAQFLDSSTFMFVDDLLCSVKDALMASGDDHDGDD